MTVQRCQEETTSSEFLEWMQYFAMEPNFFHREDHYLAQIAAWIRRSGFQHPDQVKDEDFIIKFGTAADMKETKPSKAEAAKRFFGGLLKGKAAKDKREQKKC